MLDRHDAGVHDRRVEGRACLDADPRLKLRHALEVRHASFARPEFIDLLRAKKILVTHGTGFNWPTPDHFRLVTLPEASVLEEAIGRIADFLATRR